LRRINFSQFIWVILVGCGLALSQSNRISPEQRANHYLETVRHQPLLALAFLREMPKGGDLHNHLGGAVYAEDLIDYAAQDKLCVDRATMTAVSGECDSSCGSHAQKLRADCAHQDQDFYDSLIDAWSMRNWERGRESGHDHFFATFGKFGLPFGNHIGEEIARTMQHAAADHLQYVELMHTVSGRQSAELGAKAGWDSDFSAMRDKLMAGGMKEAVTAARAELDEDQKTIQAKLGCGTPSALPACDVTVRYLYQVLRGLPPEQVFAQILMGFELASVDPRVVGLNLVMPEDWYVPMRDFNLHMRMLDYLHGIYPKVHISLHAGELALGLVPPEGMSFHIRHSIEEGHAERIGHGVDVMNEHNALDLLREMARKKILVEICLTSNDEILGVKGDEHPLPMYRKFGVPVALATDDEGVSRSDLTHEYLRAVETYALSYTDLKQMARQSLEHSFLPGASIWADIEHGRMVPACATHATESSGCKKFLDENEKARIQWKLERESAVFESRF
jgi:adenosine deaminase